MGASSSNLKEVRGAEVSKWRQEEAAACASALHPSNALAAEIKQWREEKAAADASPSRHLAKIRQAEVKQWRISSGRGTPN